MPMNPTSDAAGRPGPPPPPARGRSRRFWPLAALVCLAVATLGAADANAQGCVVSRGGGGAMLLGGDGFLEQGDWQFSAAHRFFHSDRHFVGDKEQKHRQREDTQVENFSHFIDLTATYAVHRRIWLNLTLPFVSSKRSSLYEHDRVNRYYSSAGGLGDLRFTSTFWVFDPDEYHRGNISLGAGFKAPTGDYKATDTFHRPAGEEVRYVDSSIQPGDGGWGAMIEAQAFYAFTGPLSGYVNGFYLLNPKELIKKTGFSVPDGYMARAGLSYVLWPTHASWLNVEQDLGFSVALSLGPRIEGVPPKDAIGDNGGFRRPGYSVGIEPGISFTYGRYFLSLNAPVALYRNRQQSYPESQRNPPRHGDAAFADYAIITSAAVRF